MPLFLVWQYSPMPSMPASITCPAPSVGAIALPVIPAVIWQLPDPRYCRQPPITSASRPTPSSFRLSWATNATIVVEASTNLAFPIWLPVYTNTITKGVNPLTDGWSYFRDPGWTNSPTRFYRLRSP